jgi:hypothetical protein
MKVRGFCHVAEGDCKAPAGIRTYSGISECKAAPIVHCADCGEEVCRNPSCSTRRRRGYVCFYCEQEST